MEGKEIVSDQKVIRAWTLYDWANSSYPLVITTAIFPIFYEKITSVEVDGQVVSDKIEFFGRTFINTEIYTYVVALSFIIVSISSPILSGIADYSGNKKQFMQFFCWLGALSCASLFFFNPEHLELSMLSVLFASVGFWGSLVFYNAYLPEIVPPEEHDRVSARGFASGYLGSVILLIINLVLIQVYGMPAKYSFLTVAVWWITFAQFTFSRLPVSKNDKEKKGNYIINGFQELYKVFKELRKIPRLKRFLSSFFIYSMGVQTIMLTAVFFANKEIFTNGDTSGLIIAVLIIQFIGIAGSFLFSILSKYIGNIKALGVAIFIFIGCCVGTYLWCYTPFHFYIVAGFVGLVMGGIQSLSRSTYSKLLPETEDTASYFSYYDISEKIGIVIGMFSFGLIEGITGGMRNSILALITFFIIGFLLLLTIPKSKNVS